MCVSTDCSIPGQETKRGERIYRLKWIANGIGCLCGVGFGFFLVGCFF